jgi:hypothetical protein
LLLAAKHHATVFVLTETHLSPNIIPTYILTYTRSHAFSSGPAKTDNSAYRGGFAVLSLSLDYSVSETPLPTDIPLPADYDHQILPCTLKHIPPPQS